MPLTITEGSSYRFRVVRGHAHSGVQDWTAWVQGPNSSDHLIATFSTGSNINQLDTTTQIFTVYDGPSVACRGGLAKSIAVWSPPTGHFPSPFPALKGNLTKAIASDCFPTLISANAAGATPSCSAVKTGQPTPK